MTKCNLIFLCFGLLLSCQHNPRVKKGDLVTIEFLIKNQQGRIIDQTGYMQKQMPLLVEVGEHEIFEPLEQALIGMKPGQTKTIKIPSSAAYGQKGVYYLTKNHDTIYVVQANEDLVANIKLLKGQW